jgi:enoyl-CoA hydratase/carnithine racemase
MSDLLIVKDDGPVRIIRMNRPEKKNALTLPMYAAMAEAIAGASRDDAIRCVLIAGAPGAFSAGNDLQEFLTASETGEGLGRSTLDFLHALIVSEKPLVAAVGGLAVGIGTTMLLHCDFVVATEDARFSTPFVQLGLVPEAASSLIAPRLMGHRAAFSLLVMGRPLGAEEAKVLGLVNMVVASAVLESEAMRAARDIAALPPQAVTATRRLMRGSPEELTQRVHAEAELFKARLTSPEAHAAFAHFLARKR